jgi:hypothetical protein
VAELARVQNLAEFRTLAGKNKLSKFSDFWAPDHQNTTPIKPAFTPEKLVTGRVPLLARFYDVGRTTAGGEADPLNPPYFRISQELMGRVIHTLRHEYISDDENARMSAEFKEHMKGVLAPLETTQYCMSITLFCAVNEIDRSCREATRMLLDGFAAGGSLSRPLAFSSCAAFRFLAFHSSLCKRGRAQVCRRCSCR